MIEALAPFDAHAAARAFRNTGLCERRAAAAAARATVTASASNTVAAATGADFCAAWSGGPWRAIPTSGPTPGASVAAGAVAAMPLCRAAGPG